MATFIADNVSIDPRAEIDDDVEIGPFCVIGPNVSIGRGTRLENNVTLMGHVVLGRYNHVYTGAVIGGEPQDISYAGTDTKVVIGDHNVIREGVTINRASEKEDGVTRVGDHNFLMACCHVAHDCQVGNHIIIANNSPAGRTRSRTRLRVALGGGGRASFRHHRQLQLRGRHQRRAARRSPVHAGRGLSGASAVHQRRRTETKQLPARRARRPFRSTPVALSRKVAWKTPGKSCGATATCCPK